MQIDSSKLFDARDVGFTCIRTVLLKTAPTAEDILSHTAFTMRKAGASKPI